MTFFKNTAGESIIRKRFGKKFTSLFLALVTVPVIVSCTPAQLEKSKVIAKKTAEITVASLPLMARVATAYGAPYAEIVTAFAMATNPDEYAGEDAGLEDYSDYDLDGDGNVDADYDVDGNGVPDDLEVVADGEGYPSDSQDYPQDSDSQYGDPQYGDSQYGDSANNGYDGEPLTADVDIVKEGKNGGESTRIIKDGETLTANDNYKIQIGCSQDCYAYVAQLDATGRMDPIIPGKFVQTSNPLYGGQVYSLPGDDNWFYLDNNKGLEQIYFVFSTTRRDDLEEIFGQLARTNENLVQKEQVSINERMNLTRGIAGVRQGSAYTVTQSNGDTADYISTVINGSGADLVLTRWFKHQ